MLLSIIIVSYNTRELTLQTLESVIENIKSSQLLADKTEIFVIDNNSSDDSVNAVRSFKRKITKKTQLTIIENKNNTGFAKANNQGIAKSKGEFILLLNSDTIVKNGSLEKLVKTMQGEELDDSTSTLSSYHGKLDRLGLLAAELVNPDGSHQAQGGDEPTLFSVFNQLFFLDDLPIIGKLLPSSQHTGKNARATSSEEVLQKFWVAATAVLIRREVFDEIGFLDEKIFMYAEDMEFCLRAQKHHWDVALANNVEIVHFGSASSSSKNALIGELKGLIYIWSKHKPLWQVPLIKSIIRLACYLRIGLFATILANKQKSAAYKAALAEIF